MVAAWRAGPLTRRRESPEDASAPESMFALLLNHASIHRDKRIILAYLCALPARPAEPLTPRAATSA